MFDAQKLVLSVSMTYPCDGTWLLEPHQRFYFP